MANKQDECTGRFFEGRFKAQRITDEAGLLACAMYVDLNPIRAALASTPEKSRHTSAYDRIQALKGQKVTSAACPLIRLSKKETREAIQAQMAERREQVAQRRKSAIGRRILRDAWLSPLKIDERERPGPSASHSRVRASDKGFLPLTVRDYLKLLDWTAQKGRQTDFGQVPQHLNPILKRLGIDGTKWCDLVWNFKRYFGSRIGSPTSLRADAAKRGRLWTRGQRLASLCFAAS
jgi:hypothetical protein